MPSPEHDPLVGTVIDGRYRVVDRLAEGGMGVVYRAEHVFLKREVALKRLHPDLTGQGQAAARFEREAQAAAKIDHPNVCVVHDCGIAEDGAVYIAMELLDGRPLDRRIAEAAPLPLSEIVDVAAQVCDGLARAHGLGIVHRDLKPENVMLVPRRDGPGVAAKIMDFGIAKVAQDADARKLTQAGMVFGTPQYMAPEQASGATVDARADLYALGAMIFEMATRHCPFEAPTVSALLTRHLTEPPPALEAAAPHLSFPPPFRELVARCLEKDPSWRFQTADELGRALRALAGLAAAVVAPPPGTAARGDAATLPQCAAHLAAAPATAQSAAPAALPATAPPRQLPVGFVVALVTAGLAVLLVPLLVLTDGASRSRDARADGSAAVAPRDGAPGRAPTGGVADASAAAVASPPATSAADAAPVATPPWTAGRTTPPPGPEARPLPDPAATLAAERQALEASDAELAAALALARQGRKADALRQLEWLGLRLDANAHYHYELAVLYAGRDKLPQAMAQAARAAEIDPRYGADAALLALADRALAVRAAADAARRFFGLTLDARSAEILVRSALENGRPGAVLREIRGLLQARDLLAGLPERLRLPFEAAAERTCAARKEALRAIAARPDPRMEPFLRRFRADGGCGILGLEDCYSCERAEIRAVFAALDAARAAGGTKSDGGP